MRWWTHGPRQVIVAAIMKTLRLSKRNERGSSSSRRRKANQQEGSNKIFMIAAFRELTAVSAARHLYSITKATANNQLYLDHLSRASITSRQPMANIFSNSKIAD